MSIISECIICMFQIIVCMDWKSVLCLKVQRGGDAEAVSRSKRETDRCEGRKNQSGKVYAYKEKEKKKENIKTVHREQTCPCSPLVHSCVVTALLWNPLLLHRQTCNMYRYKITVKRFMLPWDDIYFCPGLCASLSQVPDMILLLISPYKT